MMPQIQICGRPSTRPAVTFLFILAAIAFCVEAHGEGAASIPRFTNARASQEELAQAVLHSIAVGDIKAMQALSISKEEFQRFVWPELPASNPKTNLPLDFVWNELYYRSMIRMERSFDDLKGKNLELIRVVHRGKIAEYKSFLVYQDMEVVIREAGGEETPYRLFGTLIEMDGVWKVFSYFPYH
jgi:hypothetical protein